METLTQLFEAHDDIIKLLNFPDNRQSTDYTCAVSSIGTILAYYGVDYREMDMAKALGSTETEGTDVDKVIHFLNLNGLQTDIRENMNINDLIYYINKDIPVLIAIQAWGNKNNYIDEWQNGHYTVVVGYSKNKIIFSEPSLYNLGYLSYGELMNRWHDRDDKRNYVRFGIAVHGKNPKYDKNKLVKIG